VTLTINDDKGVLVRTLKGSGTAGIHRVSWDLKRQEKVSDAEATRAGVTTISEREALDWVAPGNYTVILQAGALSSQNVIVVKKESAGVNLAPVRK
ncbi:MAG: hypothetical protein M3R67_14145, partial [Acidobacteriota bacterium]|nr:hypothetical protein [Acidobacteriota bacterium]